MKENEEVLFLKRLQGRIAIVTGASRRIGIGAATCRALAAEGADLLFTHWRSYDRTIHQGSRDEEVDELLQELRGMGVRAVGYEADLSDAGAARRVMDAAFEQLGMPSVLVNNAAYSTNDNFQMLDAASLDAHYAVNMRNTALLSVEFARRFAGGTGGRIINMTSGQSLGPMPGEIAYVMSKGAVEALTKTLAAEVGHKGITVNAVNPGPTDTGWMTEDLHRELTQRFALGRMGMPQDAARLIAFLASDDAEWITGQVIHSTGGFH